MKTISLESIDSTNTYLKKIKNPTEDVLVFAKRQTGGRGTKGRSFICEEGGIYLSLLKLYPCDAKDSFSIMMNSALAVVKTLRAFDVKAKIKWPNDIIVNGKKICGILIENVFEGEHVARSIVGIGLNVNNPLADEIKDIAISIKEVLNKEICLQTVLATLVYNLYLPSSYEEYKKHLLYLGEEVTLTVGGEEKRVIMNGVLENGNLQTSDGEVFSSAEITLRKA